MSEYIEFKEIETSAIESVDYDEKTTELVVTFRDSRSYKYFNVPVVVFRNFVNSPVKSKFFNNIIRGYYDYKKM